MVSTLDGRLTNTTYPKPLGCVRWRSCWRGFWSAMLWINIWPTLKCQGGVQLQAGPDSPVHPADSQAVWLERCLALIFLVWQNLTVSGRAVCPFDIFWPQQNMKNNNTARELTGWAGFRKRRSYMNLRSILGGKVWIFLLYQWTWCSGRILSSHAASCLKKTNFLEVWGVREYGFFTKIMKHTEHLYYFPYYLSPQIWFGRCHALKGSLPTDSLYDLTESTQICKIWCGILSVTISWRVDHFCLFWFVFSECLDSRIWCETCLKFQHEFKKWCRTWASEVDHRWWLALSQQGKSMQSWLKWLCTQANTLRTWEELRWG